MNSTFRTNVNIFGLGARQTFEAEHTEFLQAHVDSGMLDLLPTVARDAGTGQFVTEEYAEEHPDTTVVETVKEAPESPSAPVAVQVPTQPAEEPQAAPSEASGGVKARGRARK